MQQSPTFVGIDISKETLDIYVVQDNVNKHYTIANQTKTVKKLFTSLMLAHPLLYIGMENTGYYNFNLYQALAELELDYYVIAPLHLKKSLGLSRGKNDKIDARRIATFLDLNLKNLSVYKPPRAILRQLNLLLTIRSQRIKIRKQLGNNKEQYQYIDGLDNNPLLQADVELIAHIEQQIKAIELQIQQLIASDNKLQQQYKLITSVQGVGKVLGWHLLVRTGEFAAITEPRKLACYAGIAPFEHSSGTSVRGRTRVSQYADKGLKTLFHMAAMSSIRLEGDLKDYYQRKVAEGKNKMSTLNAVRNKIIHRIYAVLKNQRPYQKYLTNPLAMS